MKYPSKLNMLYTAIHQMTKSEKRLFRLEINKLKKDTAYSKLFDYILILKAYDEEKIKSYFHTKEIPNFNVLVNHLFDKSITFLTNHRPLPRQPIIEMKVKQILNESQTVLQLGFPEKAHKTMKKALKVALENEIYDLVNRCLKNIFFIETVYSHLRLSHTDIVGNLPTELTIRKYNQLQGIGMELYILMVKANNLSATPNTTAEDWKMVIENTTLKNVDWNILNFVGKTTMLRIHIICSIWFTQYEKTIELSHKLLNCYNDDESKLSRFQAFISDYSGLCHILYMTKNTHFKERAFEFSQLFDKNATALKASMPEAKFHETLALHRLLNRIVQQCNLLRIGSFTIHDADRWSSGIHMESIRPWNYYWCQNIIISAYMYLLLKKYDRFQDYQNIILKYKEDIHRNAIMVWEIEILDLIEIYENNTEVYFSNYLKTFLRKNKQKADTYETIAYMLVLFNKLRKTTTPKEVLKAALPEITAFETTQKVHNLQFSTWVRWRCK